jgi:hypothetical protein
MSNEEESANIDLTQIVQNEFNIGVLQRTVNMLLNNMSPMDRPNQSQLEDIKERVAKDLNEKYPGAGIGYKRIDS